MNCTIIKVMQTVIFEGENQAEGRLRSDDTLKPYMVDQKLGVDTRCAEAGGWCAAPTKVGPQ